LKRLHVRWSTAAFLDVIEIVEFAQNDRPIAAGKLGREILRAAPLRQHPQSGKIVPELREHGISDYRQLILFSYRLIYTVSARNVDIVAVVDSRRDLQTAVFHRLMR
jgi:toxin ParE1/3/4